MMIQEKTRNMIMSNNLTPVKAVVFQTFNRDGSILAEYREEPGSFQKYVVFSRQNDNDSGSEKLFEVDLVTLKAVCDEQN